MAVNPNLVKDPFAEGLVKASPLAIYCVKCGPGSSIGRSTTTFRHHFVLFHKDEHPLPPQMTGMSRVFDAELLRAKGRPLSDFYNEHSRTEKRHVCAECNLTFAKKQMITKHVQKPAECYGANFERKECVQLICGTYAPIPSDVARIDKQQSLLVGSKARFLQPGRYKQRVHPVITRKQADIATLLRPLLQRGADLGSWPKILYPLLADGDDFADDIQQLRKQIDAEVSTAPDAVMQKMFDLTEYMFDDRPYAVVNLSAQIKTILQKFTGVDELELASNWVFHERKSYSPVQKICNSLLAYMHQVRCPTFMEYYTILAASEDTVEDLYAKGFLSSLIVDLVCNEDPGHSSWSEMEIFSLIEFFTIKNEHLRLLRPNYAGKVINH